MPANSPRPLRKQFTAATILLCGILAAVLLATACGKDKQSSGQRHGLVRLEGAILDVREVVDWMRALREDDKVLGVLVRIDSPGGVVGPSQELHQAMVRLSRAKPTVVSMGAVCASGGYYAACPAQRIFANPGTLTGSIGVRMELTNLMELMEKIGVSHDSITSGKFKDVPSPFRNMTAEERGYVDALVQDMHRQFVTDIATSRTVDNATLARVADGRILTGSQAKELGLVDELGGQEDALDWLRNATGKGTLPLDEGPKDKRNWIEKLMKAASPLTLLDAPRWQALYR